MRGVAGIDTTTSEYMCRLIYLLQQATKEEDINNIFIDLPFYLHLNIYDTDTITVKKDFNKDIQFYYNNIFLDSIPALDKNIPLLTIKK